jgi:arabinofuranosyltransferase
MNLISRLTDTHKKPFVVISSIGVVSALSFGSYLLASHNFFRLGFPLDDAWIHQTYARNLALQGEWAYNPGVSSGGSTGPLWSAILTVGYLLRLPPLIWTYIMGWLALWGISVLGVVAYKEIYPQGIKYSPWIGLLLSLEWHLVWMAGSGMETLLFSLIATLVLVCLLRWHENPIKWAFIGGCIGLSVWLRPDGVTLLGPALVVLFFPFSDRKGILRICTFFVAGFMLVFFPYLLFNQLTAGSWWPNTFFAKQAEFDELRNTPFLFRLLDQMLLPLVGVGISLLPGFILNLIDTIRDRRWDLIAVFLWMGGFLCMYAWRLPVTYQHGRYVMPMMPVAFIIGFAGMCKWAIKEAQSRWWWVLKRVWVISLVIVLSSFWVLGVQAYVWDVAYIESEMVDTAYWLNRNLPENALIASHDIGAVGYFCNQELIDLAGLITPEVIPFMRDENQLGEYLDEQGVEYLVTFPDWYPELVSRAELIYQTDGTIAPSMDHDNLAVYRWNSP